MTNLQRIMGIAAIAVTAAMGAWALHEEGPTPAPVLLTAQEGASIKAIFLFEGCMRGNPGLEERPDETPGHCEQKAGITQAEVHAAIEALDRKYGAANTVRVIRDSHHIIFPASGFTGAEIADMNMVHNVRDCIAYHKDRKTDVTAFCETALGITDTEALGKRLDAIVDKHGPTVLDERITQQAP